MAASRKIPKRYKDVIKAAERGEWELVFGAYGIKLSTKRPGELSKAAGKGPDQSQYESWSSLVKTVKADFWGLALPFCLTDGEKLDAVPLLPIDIMDKKVLPSLDVQMVKCTMSRLEVEETRLMKLALAEDEWAPLTVVLFVLCRCGLLTKLFKDAVRRAVGAGDWRYVDVVAVDCTKYYLGKNQDMLECLGLSEVLTESREKRKEAICRLLGNEDWDDVTLEIVFKTLTVWSRLGGVSVHKWTVLLDVLDDFSCETKRNIDFLQKSIGYVITMKHYDVQQLVELGLTRRKHSVLQGVCLYVDLTAEQASRALPIAFEAKDWEMVISYLIFGAEADQYINGESILHTIIDKNEFQFVPEFLPAWSIDLRVHEFSLLHLAVDRWVKDCGGYAVHNVLFLLENDADPFLPYPSGETPFQTLLVPRVRKKTQDDRRVELIIMAAESTVRNKRTIDWTPEPKSQWNALHVMCHKGAVAEMDRLIKLGANPLQHRQGLSLLDTTIKSVQLPFGTMEKVLRFLFTIDDLIDDHVRAVESRPPSQYPIIFLLKAIRKMPYFFMVIKILLYRDAFADSELREAMKESNLSALRKDGLDVVADYLERKVDLVPVLAEDLQNVNVDD